jgi:hypothetical protein
MPVGLLQLGYTQGHQEEGYLAEPHVSLMLLSNNKSTQCCALNIYALLFLHDSQIIKSPKIAKGSQLLIRGIFRHLKTA